MASLGHGPSHRSFVGRFPTTNGHPPIVSIRFLFAGCRDPQKWNQPKENQSFSYLSGSKPKGVQRILWSPAKNSEMIWCIRAPCFVFVFFNTWAPKLLAGLGGLKRN